MVELVELVVRAERAEPQVLQEMQELKELLVTQEIRGHLVLADLQERLVMLVPQATQERKDFLATLVMPALMARPGLVERQELQETQAMLAM